MQNFFRSVPTPASPVPLIPPSHQAGVQVIDTEFDTEPAVTFEPYKSDIDSNTDEDSLNDLRLKAESEDESEKHPHATFPNAIKLDILIMMTFLSFLLQNPNVKSLIFQHSKQKPWEN